MAVDRGLIVAVGGPGEPAPEPPRSRAPALQSSRASEFPSYALLPALVNAHVHLELSSLRGAVPPADSMPAWASRLIATRRSALGESAEPICAAIAEVRASGTTLVGEVTNTLASYEPLAQSALSAAVFFEQLGFRTGDARGLAGAAQATIHRLPANRRLRVSVVPHAPYSVSPALLQAIASQGGRPIMSIHLGESPEELQFLQDGSGAWRGLLDALGVWDDAWTPPRCGPVAYLDQLELVDDRLIAVHGVQLTDVELECLAAAHATVVTCPRSNSWTGAGAPPIERFYRSGVRVAVGTDSLASVETLNLFDELARMRTIAPTIPAWTLLETATRTGAEALGFGAELGTIAPGKRAELIAVRLPGRVADVEEYLVSGIQPPDIGWLETHKPSR